MTTEDILAENKRLLARVKELEDYLTKHGHKIKLYDKYYDLMENPEHGKKAIKKNKSNFNKRNK